MARNTSRVSLIFVGVLKRQEHNKEGRFVTGKELSRTGCSDRGEHRTWQSHPGTINRIGRREGAGEEINQHATVLPDRWTAREDGPEQRRV